LKTLGFSFDIVSLNKIIEQVNCKNNIDVKNKSFFALVINHATIEKKATRAYMK